MSIGVALGPATTRGRRARPPVDGILGAIGDTPLVRLRRLLGRDDIQAWAKLESRTQAAARRTGLLRR